MDFYHNKKLFYVNFCLLRSYEYWLSITDCFCLHECTIQHKSHTEARTKYRPLIAKYCEAMGSSSVWMRISVSRDCSPVPIRVLMPKIRPKQLSSVIWPAILALKRKKNYNLQSTKLKKYTCLVHTLSIRNLPMLKGAYKSYFEVRN
jgi:hypothetical protein